MNTANKWVLVANGHKAAIVKSVNVASDTEIVRLDTDELNSADEKSGENAHRDKPGTSFHSAGKGRSSMEPRSSKDRVIEKRFLNEVVDYLVNALRHKELTHLNIFAAPQTLGDIRQLFPTELQNITTSLSEKDLVNLPDSKLLDTVREKVH